MLKDWVEIQEMAEALKKEAAEREEASNESTASSSAGAENVMQRAM